MREEPECSANTNGNAPMKAHILFARNNKHRLLAGDRRSMREEPECRGKQTRLEMLRSENTSYSQGTTHIESPQKISMREEPECVANTNGNAPMKKHILFARKHQVWSYHR